MVYSPNPNGPWSAPLMIPGTDVFADSNFAPVILHNGSVVGLTRSASIFASSWKNVSSYRAVGVFRDAGEDPYVWVTPSNPDVYHAIVYAACVPTHFVLLAQRFLCR